MHTITFTAVSTVTTLEFLSTTGSGWGPVVDNVGVLPVDMDFQPSPPLDKLEGGDAADYDQDGDTDIIGVKTFDGRLFLLHPPDLAVTMVNSTFGHSGVHFVDVDGDGFSGYAATGGNEVRIFEFTPGSGFSSVQTVPITGAARLDVGDYDNDGDQDIAVATVGLGNNKFHVLRNDSGTFSVVYSSATYTDYVISIQWRDFDNDPAGDLELMTWGWSPFGSTIWKYDGLGSFNPAFTPPAGPGRIGPAAVGDVDGDGDQDIAVRALDDGGKIYLYTNNGGFSFSRSLIIGVGTNSVAVADFDQDGDGDILAPRIEPAPTGTYPRIYVADAAGAWHEAWPPAPIGSPNNLGMEHIIILDWDQNGMPDFYGSAPFGIGALWTNGTAPPNPPNTPPTVDTTPPATGTFTVPGKSCPVLNGGIGLFDTGLTLSGNTVSITASGAWTCAGPVGGFCSVGPDGTGTPASLILPSLLKGFLSLALSPRLVVVHGNSLALVPRSSAAPAVWFWP